MGDLLHRLITVSALSAAVMGGCGGDDRFVVPLGARSAGGPGDEMGATPSVLPPLLASPTAAIPAAIQIIIGSAAPAPDGTVLIDVTLRTDGIEVGTLQNDIVFDNTVVRLSGANACTINPVIGDRDPRCMPDHPGAPCKTLIRNLAPCNPNQLLPGCPADAGENISRFRAQLAARVIQNDNAIPDGVLYTCRFTVVDPDRLPAALTVGMVAAGDRRDLHIGSVEGMSGEVEQPLAPLPTRTPTQAGSPPAATPAATATAIVLPLGGRAEVRIGSSQPNAAGMVEVPVFLFSMDAAVGGMQNDILFDNRVLSLPSASACRINPEIAERAASCDQDPPVGPCKTLARALVRCGDGPHVGCPADAGPEVSRFRALIANTAVITTTPIPSGVVLYTCSFDLVDSQRLPTLLTTGNVFVSDPFGNLLSDVTATNGVVEAAPMNGN